MYEQRALSSSSKRESSGSFPSAPSTLERGNSYSVFVSAMASADESVLKNSAASSSNTRVLPSWGTSSVSSNTGSRVSTKKPPPSKRESALNSQKLPSSKVFKNSRWHTVRHNNHKKPLLNHGSETDDQLPQKDAKRMLPSYLQNPSSSSSRPSLQRHDNYEKLDLPTSSSHATIHPQDNFSWDHNDVAMKSNHGSRLLPPSMNPPMSVSTTQYAGQFGHSRPGVVEETVGDERLIYQVALRDLYQPTTEATIPDGLLSVPLFRHQKIALAWMLDKENSVACSGGILADDQGLGKTVSVIALIQMQKSLSKPKLEDPKAEALDLDDDNDKDIVDSSRAEREFHNQKPPGGSLVVCPASVLRQWAQELDEKVADESKLEVLIYHGVNRTNDPHELAKYDVVLTTYSIVAKEIPSKDFDEDEDDDDDDTGYAKKRKQTKDTLIGGKPVINLPPKTIKLTAVDFSNEERAFYLKLEAESRSQYKAYQAAGTVRQNYANILLMLLRLRQACDHPLLVKGFNSQSTSQDSRNMAKNLPKDMQLKLLHLLETLNICVLCSDPPEDAVVTICGHVFCYQCVSEYLTGDENTCPSPDCKSQIDGDVVFSKSTLRSCISDDDDEKIDERCLDFENDYASSKIRATLEIIKSHCGSNDSGPIKAIIFSQWTRMLDLVEMSLDQHCIEFRRLDGSMSLVSRDRAVKEFNTDPEVIVMLMSLKAGNVGLNMVAASHVILVDLWWNPATEDQAIDRAHRIGQTRPVTVSRLTVKDTVEDRILALQEEKRKMISSAFGEDQSGSSGPRLTAQDLKYLFMGSH
ncbi:hypothetical protein L1887_33714 [Cichorium endivia]|nr:hypothetical protein L1887_33714 [Cichorium endivia]